MRRTLGGLAQPRTVFPVSHVRAQRNHCRRSLPQFHSPDSGARLNRLPPVKRPVRMCSTTDVSIPELEGLCMASLQGLGYSHDEARVLTEVRIAPLSTKLSHVRGNVDVEFPLLWRCCARVDVSVAAFSPCRSAAQTSTCCSCWQPSWRMLLHERCYRCRVAVCAAVCWTGLTRIALHAEGGSVLYLAAQH
jgi:hypothetical protein